MTKKKAATATIDPVVQAAMDEHGDCAAFTVRGKLFVFRPLELDEFETFQARAKKTEPGPLNRECCQTALVHPTLDELKEAFESAPGLAAVAATAIMQMAMASVEIVVKKG